MRNLLVVCAGLLSVAGIVSVNLWRELHAERQQTKALRQQLSESQAALFASSSSRMQVMTPSAPVPAVTIGPTSGGTSEAQTVARDSDRPVSQNTDIPRIIFNQQEMMKDPEYRKARLAQMRMAIRQNYPGLADELGLTPEEADSLFDLLAENQLGMTNLSMLAATINGGQPEPAAVEDANRRRMEMQGRQEESLMAMLGDSRYLQWQDYQQTRGPRQQVMQLSRSLDGMGMPLSSEQSRYLTAAYIAEYNRQPEDIQPVLASSGQSGPVDQERAMEESYKLQGESNRRIVEAAKPHLNSQQLDALQASLDQQLAMNRASNRLMRRQMGAQGQSAAPVISFIGTAPPVPVF